VEFHVRAQREGVGLAVLADRPRACQRRLDAAARLRFDKAVVNVHRQDGRRIVEHLRRVEPARRGLVMAQHALLRLRRRE
jgi:hypothetical protein